MNAKPKNSAPTSPDPDAVPEISDDWIAEADLFQGEKLVRRGRPRVAAPRQLLSSRLPPNVIARWKASGPGWQTRMAQVLENSAPAATPPSD